MSDVLKLVSSDARDPSQCVDDVSALVGDTPLVRLRAVAADLPDAVEVWAKLEFHNPGGSVKDRAARQIIMQAEADGSLEGRTLLDATSGNTGVAYSMIGAARGHEVHLVMPGNVSQARKDICEAYGTHIIYSDPMEQSDGAIRLARKLASEDDEGKYYYADQYSNPANPGAHFETTGPEIWEQTQHRVTHFVAGLGTSGTIMGTGRRLKAYDEAIQVIGVEPDDSFHGLEGLKHMESSIVPPIFDPSLLDRRMGVATEDGWDMAERLAREEGLPVGHSAGAAAVAALRVARELERGVVVTLFPDHADRYFAPRRRPGRPG